MFESRRGNCKDKDRDAPVPIPETKRAREQWKGALGVASEVRVGHIAGARVMRITEAKHQKDHTVSCMVD